MTQETDTPEIVATVQELIMSSGNRRCYVRLVLPTGGKPSLLIELPSVDRSLEGLIDQCRADEIPAGSVSAAFVLAQYQVAGLNPAPAESQQQQ